MGTPRARLLGSLAVLVLVAALLGAASTFSAFTGTTADAGNTFAAGTVVIGDNDSGSASLSMSNARPGDTDTTCIQVTSTGTLPSLVRLYGTTGGSGLDAHLSLVVTRGSGAAGFDDCTGFTADATDWNGLGAGVVYSGTLTAFPDSYAAGVVDPRPSAPEAWTTGETHTYRFALTVADNDLAQGKSFTQTFTWEARNASGYSQVVLSDNPASYWRLDEVAGTTAADSAGAINGTYTNGPALNQTSGVRDAGTAVRFDGTNDYITMGDNYDFAGTVAYSLELWVNPTAANSNWRRIISKDRYVSSSDRGGWNLTLAAASDPIPNKVAFGRYDGGSGSTAVNSTIGLQPGTWYHLVVTYTGTQLRLYVNGTQHGLSSSIVSVEDHTTPMRVGNRPVTDHFGGTLDEIAIYGYALSAQQVTEHYNAGRP